MEGNGTVEASIFENKVSESDSPYPKNVGFRNFAFVFKVIF